MFICNGRMCNDKGVGKFTSKDASVVDYVIDSISFLKLLKIHGNSFQQNLVPQRCEH
jgi:hypothetical protein